MRSVKSSVKRWKTAAIRLTVVIDPRPLGPAAGWAQEPAQPRIRGGNLEAEKNLSEPGRRCSRRLRHLPRALGLRGISFLRLLRRARQAWHLGPLAGYRRGRRASHTGLLRTPRRRGDGGKVRPARRFSERGRDVHRGPPDGRMAPAGREPRRTYTVSQRQVRCGTIRSRSLENSRLLPMSTAASPIPTTCPGSWKRF